MVAAGYGLAFTRFHFPPTEYAGRLTSVHLGATLGAAIVVAAVVSLGWSAARSRCARAGAVVATALLLGALLAFHVAVQRGFVRSAEHQRRYWCELVGLLPDLTEGSVVVLLGAEPPESEFVLTGAWADTLVLPLLLRPSTGRPPQLVGTVVPFEESFLEARDGALWWSARAPSWLEIDRSAPLPADLFVLERHATGWRRRAGAITWQGLTRELAAPRPAAVPLPLGPLAPLLLGAPRAGAAAP
jgi:hypothetical protein